MNEYLQSNKISFFMEKENSTTLAIWFAIFFTLTMLGVSLISIRIPYNVISIYNEESKSLDLIWPYEQISMLNDFEKVLIDRKEKDFKIINLSEIKINEQATSNYQIVSIESPEKYFPNQVVQLKILDKKEKIIIKIKKIILGG